MKKALLLILLFVSIAGSAQKAEYDVVNDFLEVELSKKDYDTIFVIEQPLQKTKSIQMYKEAFKQKDVSNASSEKQIWVYPETIFWPWDEKNVDEIEIKLQKENDKPWTNKDFKNQNFIFYPEKIVRSRDFIISNISANKYVFNLSRPLLNKNKDFAIFQFYPSFLVGGGSSANDGLILMEKKGDKWIQVAVMQYAVYN